MYFASRMQAGRMLANQIAPKYAGQDCVVVALSDGGVVVGSQIALALHAPLCMILSDEIQLPRELTALAGITQSGSFSYNHAYSDGEITEMAGEYRGAIEQQKLEKLHRLHRDAGGGALIREDMLDEKIIFLVSDGLNSGFAIDLALEYLKPVSYKSLVMAVPFASVQAVDRMHVLASDLYCLNVIADYFSTDHYYDTNDVPNHELVLKTVSRIVADWKPAKPGELEALKHSTQLHLPPQPSANIETQTPSPLQSPRRDGKVRGLLAKFKKIQPRVKLPTRRRFTVDTRGGGSGRSK